MTGARETRERRAQAPSSDWWFVRAYPGSSRAMDDAVAATVPWLRARAEEIGAERWFFMRYMDTTGHHVRLRIQGAPDALDAVHARSAALRDVVGSLPAPPEEDRRLLPGAQLGDQDGSRDVRASVYSPELRKYGGPRGFALVVDDFHRASRWYDDHRIGELPQATGRTALAARLQERLVRAALPGATEQQAFWTDHRRQWGRQLRMLLPGRESLAAPLARVRDVVEGTPSDPRSVAALDERIGALTTVLDRAEDDAPAVPRRRLLLELMHMEMNRWGLMPAEECLVGLTVAADTAGATTSTTVA